MYDKKWKTMRKNKITQKSKLKPAQAYARQGSVYDKAIKENFEKSLKTIIQNVDGLHIVKSQPLRTKMQHTKERDPDELSKIWLSDGTEAILHAEVHLKDEDEVNFRLCDYHVMIKRLHKTLLLVQYVVYIGNENPKYIKGEWQTESLMFRYHVIILKDIPYQLFLQADNPETVVFSILANFQGEEPDIVGEKIAARLNKLAKTHANREKYYTQLRVLSNIRKLQPIIDKVMANIFKLIDISEDPLYVKGIEKGKTEGILEGILEGEIKGKLKGIEALIINTDFDNSYIALLMDVPIQLVMETRKKLSKL